jgi:hypothetical protein
MQIWANMGRRTLLLVMGTKLTLTLLSPSVKSTGSRKMSEVSALLMNIRLDLLLHFTDTCQIRSAYVGSLCLEKLRQGT